MFNRDWQRFGIPSGTHTERQQPYAGPLEQFGASATGPAVRWVRIQRLRLPRLVRAVTAHGGTLQQLSTHALGTMTSELRGQLRRQGFTRPIVAQTFALVREMAERTLDMRPFDVQVMGGWVLLHGMVAEMDTGEGKTLTATLPACTVALAGVPVHIITVNDYLARRDAEAMQPLYQALGLKVGVVTHAMDLQARRHAYACDVTYCTNKEVVFDYLKDRLLLGRKISRMQLQLDRLCNASHRCQPLLRGLYFAIVDEADSVLIDEARTPLLISGGANDTFDRDVYATALRLAAQLELGHDFVLQEHERTVQLTDPGRARLAALVKSYGGVWNGRQLRQALLCQALTAQHLMQRDIHYLVQNETIQIIDEYTGRAMAGRSWEYGLQQLIETKESCPLSKRHEPLARLSYQRFFRRYLRLAGMTGTAREVPGELWAVYRLAVVSVPPHRPPQRCDAGEHVFATAAAKWQAVVARTTTLHHQGRPVLIGTRSVAASEYLSRLLTAAGLPHQVLNARQDREEAAVLAQAGIPGRITVATNMAGRGTDICLAPGVAQRGGLHVMATERHEARRIDRQLFGRCGRQGDPGSYEIFVALEDELVAVHSRRLWWWLSRWMFRHCPATARWLGSRAVRQAQRRAERLHARMRRDLFKRDEYLEVTLAFSGRPE